MPRSQLLFLLFIYFWTVLSGKCEKGLTFPGLSARTLKGPGTLALSKPILGMERTVSIPSWACCDLFLLTITAVHPKYLLYRSPADNTAGQDLETFPWYSLFTVAYVCETGDV